MKVKIEEKKNLGKGILTEGVVKEILTPGLSHPYGMMVTLENGIKGRVKEILTLQAEMENKNKSITVLNKDNYQVQIPRLEDLRNENKATFKLDLKKFENTGEKVKDPQVEKEISLTISAFANKEGGHLHIGIKDNGEVIGLENEMKFLGLENKDKLSLSISDSIKTHIRNIVFILNLQMHFPIVDGKMICVIDVPSSDEPIFVHSNNKQEFYVRMLTGRSEKLELEEILKFCSKRFPKYFDHEDRW